MARVALQQATLQSKLNEVLGRFIQLSKTLILQVQLYGKYTDWGL